MVKKHNLQFIRDNACRNRIERLLDQMERAADHGGIEGTDFFDPYTLEIALSIMDGEEGLFYLATGGYEAAERKRIFFTYGDQSWLTDTEISLFQGRVKKTLPDHREILGSLMALGLGREKFGDIVFDETCFYVFMVQEVESYVLANLLTVGRDPVQGGIASCDDFLYIREAGEKKGVSAASLRLDAIVAALIPTSRSRAQELVKKEEVKVNHRVETRPSFEVSPGDLISIRKHGRFQLGTEWKESKKGRLHFEVEKF